MHRYAQPFPVLPGKSDADLMAIAEYFNEHPDEYLESRRAAGVTLERAYLQKTPMGEVVAVYLEGEDPVDGNRRFAASSAPFDRWFKDELKKLLPPEVDFDQPVPGVREFFDSQVLHL